MKLIVNNRHIKTVPLRYCVIKDMEDHLDDLEHKRLSDNERKCLDRQLRLLRFKAELNLFMSDLKKDDPVVFALVSGQGIKRVCWIKTKHSHYASIVFNNKIEVKCPEVLFDLAEKENKLILNRLY